MSRKGNIFLVTTRRKIREKRVGNKIFILWLNLSSASARRQFTEIILSIDFLYNLVIFHLSPSCTFWTFFFVVRIIIRLSKFSKNDWIRDLMKIRDMNLTPYFLINWLVYEKNRLFRMSFKTTLFSISQKSQKIWLRSTEREAKRRLINCSHQVQSFWGKNIIIKKILVFDSNLINFSTQFFFLVMKPS